MVRPFRALLHSLLIAACALSLSSLDLAAQVQDNGDNRAAQSSHSANNKKKRRRARRAKSARRLNTSPPQTLTTTEQPATMGGGVKGVPNDENSGDNVQPLIPVPAPTPTPRPPLTRPISGGVLNGKAIALPMPVYPAIARSARAAGTVVVQVTVDEGGRVISARAISGHPLLQSAAVQAAYGARFPPTQLSGQPVKVTGIISYSFSP